MSIFHKAFSAFICLSGMSFAKPATTVEKQVDQVLSRYRQAKSVKMDVTREVFQALTEKKLQASGTFLVSQGRMRMELEAPDKSVIVLNGPNLWLATYLPEEFGGKCQVTKLKTNKLGKAATWLAVVFGQRNAWKEFKVTENKQSGDLNQITLAPLDDKATEISKLELRVDFKNRELKGVTVWDELENTTAYEFSKSSFNVKYKASAFEFKPPKDAEVMEL